MILLYYVIKECNHDMNAMPFRLFREQRPQNILSGVIRDRLVVLLFQLSDVK